MKKYIIILFFVFQGIVSSFGQKALNFPTVDRESYQLYLAKDWKGVVKLGNKALAADIDFYYLRMRMGIAYYQQKRYAQAAKHFAYVYKENVGDPVLSEYLYYSYLLSGQYRDARMLKATFKSKQKMVMELEEDKFIEQVYFEFIQYELTDLLIDKPLITDVMEQSAKKNQSYFNLSISHPVNERTTLYHGFSRINSDSYQRTDGSEYPMLYDLAVNQNEYYVSLNKRLDNGLDLNVAAHLLSTHLIGTDTIPLTSPMPRFGQSEITLYDYKERSVAASVSVSKRLTLIELGLGTSIGIMNSGFQLQPEASLLWYPFGNTQLYTTTTASFLLNATTDGTYSNPIFSQAIALSFFKIFRIESSASFGRMQNFMEYNAFVANNDLDATFFRYQAKFNVAFSNQRINLFVRYRHADKVNEYTINDTDYTQDYINQSITGGLQWYF